MAMIRCGECKARISDKAASCPSCGAPVIKKEAKAASKKSPVLAIVIIGFIFWVFSGSKSDSPPQDRPSTQEKTVAKACAKGDLSCWGEKNSVAAGVRCKRPIESFAKYDFKWTDGFLEPKMSRYRWSSVEDNIVTYIGDKVQFQNGFGAFSNMIYECDISSDGSEVLDVRVREGKLRG